MNDLAEKALQGLEVAYRVARARAVVVMGVLGFAVSAVIVVAGGRVGAARATRPLITWFGIQDTHGIQADDPVPGTVLIAAVAVLVLLWLVTVELVRRRDVPERAAWAVVAAWAAPLALGPPLFDTSTYSYAAFGLLQRAGLDPYTADATRLGFQPIAEAVDPSTRGLSSSNGPAATLLQHLAVSVSAGSALGTVIAFRVVAVLSTIWIGRLAADMGGRRPARAVSLTALNPLVLLFVVSAGHLEGLATAVALQAIAAANRQRRTSAVVLACVAGSVLTPLFAVAGAIVAVHVYGRRSRPAVGVLARDLATAAGTIAAIGFVVPDGFGWVRTARDQFATHTPFSIAEATSTMLAPVVRGASYDTLTASSRLAAVIAMVVGLAYLAASAGSRPLERTAGYALLLVGLFAPTLYPWYLLAGTLCIAPSANATRKIWVLALSAGGCLLMPGGFAERTTDVLTACGLGVVAVVSAVGLRHALVHAADDDGPAPDVAGDDADAGTATVGTQERSARPGR